MAGSLPIDWSVTSLSACASWYSGGTPRTSVAEYWDGNIPWITASSLHEFYIRDSERRITRLGLENGTRLMPANSILFVVRGMSLKTEFRVGIARRPVAFGQDCKALVANDGIDPLYLANVLRAKSQAILGLVDEASHGTGRLQTGALRRLEIQIPPFAEQQAIACILGALDDKIELNRRMNETLEATAQALFKSWFVDFLPVRAKAEGRDPCLPPHIADLFPAEFEESELGEIPKGWKVEPIGNIVKAVGGGTPSTKNPAYWDEGVHPFATPKDLSGLSSPILLATERCVTDAGLAKISSGLLPVGTVLLSSRAPVGYLAITQIPVCVNQGFIAMVCDGKASQYYVLNWAQVNLPEIKRRAGGTTFAEISKTNFRPIPALVPSPKVMTTFDTIVGPLYTKIGLNLEQSRTLAALRDALLPKLISGELRVPDAEGMVQQRAHFANQD